MKKWLLIALLSACFALVPLQAQAAHQTVLTWNSVPNTPPSGSTAGITITAYNLYKGTASGGYTLGTPFQSLSSVTLTFTDTNVTAGGTAFYVVTAVCASCSTKESVFSNEVKAVTPLNQAPQPAAPGLTVTVQ